MSLSTKVRFGARNAPGGEMEELRELQVVNACRSNREP